MYIYSTRIKIPVYCLVGNERHRNIIMIKEFVEKRRWGNDPCMANVVAYILGVPREGVPNFYNHEDFHVAVENYLYSWGLKIVIYDPEKHVDSTDIIHYGKNERDIEHVVVCDKEGKLLFDSFSIGGPIVGEVDKYVILPYGVN